MLNSLRRKPSTNLPYFDKDFSAQNMEEGFISVKLPKISIVIPTYNEEKSIARCLNAILSQSYPKELIEIIIVDNESTDKTIEIIAEYMNRYKIIRLLYNKIVKDPEVSKMIGLKNATGDLFLYLDSDIEIVGKDWLSHLIKPLIEDPTLIGSFPRFIPKPDDVAIGRYLRYHPLELDPVFQFFCTEIDDTIIESRNGYKICEFHPPKIPPIGICVYRKEILLEVLSYSKKFMDIDVPVILSKKGFNHFAYVPTCGIYHTNVKSLKDLIKRRLRNLEKVYLPNIDIREFKYFDLSKSRDIAKIAFWIIYANIFIPKLVTGFYKMLKYRDFALLYEPIIALVLTDVLAFSFIKNMIFARLHM